MMKPESKRPITIEDLLRLKRAERPPAEFWNDFDRALRAKQLAALVGKRPWWQTMPRVLFGFRRYHISIGVSAAVALTFLVVRSYEGSVAAPRAESSGRNMAVAAVTTQAQLSEARTEIAATNGVAEQGARNETTSADEPGSPGTVVATLASEATAPGEISRMLPLIGTSTGEPAQSELTPSARAIAANLASVRGNEPVLARTLLSSSSAEVRPAARPAIEPLHQIASPTERRRSNLLTAMVAMTAYETPMRTSERAAAQLSSDELYERIHRFGARGNSVNMKF